MTTEKEATLILGGEFSEVVGGGTENKTKFLKECTRKLSNNSTRSVKCIDVRPGSIIVVIGGDAVAVVEAVKSVEIAGYFELDGYESMEVQDVIFPKLAPTSQPPTGKPEENIFTYLLENGSVRLPVDEECKRWPFMPNIQFLETHKCVCCSMLSIRAFVHTIKLLCPEVSFLSQCYNTIIAVGVLVGVCFGLALVILNTGISIFICCKCCKRVKEKDV